MTIPHILKGNDQVVKIASFLTEHFVKGIYNTHPEKSYSAYISSLSEILVWAQEFHIRYPEMQEDWKSFEGSSRNIYTAVSSEGFLIAWGKDKMNQYQLQHAGSTENSSGKINTMKIAEVART